MSVFGVPLLNTIAPASYRRTRQRLRSGITESRGTFFSISSAFNSPSSNGECDRGRDFAPRGVEGCPDADPVFAATFLAGAAGTTFLLMSSLSDCEVESRVLLFYKVYVPLPQSRNILTAPVGVRTGATAEADRMIMAYVFPVGVFAGFEKTCRVTGAP
jgi:hypothetical protein